MNSRTALHYVFRVGDRKATIDFYKNILGMKILRHEEFEDGCKATCNGPYDGKWSKSMVGYGPEDSHFVVELTYNYGIGKYNVGNDFQGITIYSKQAVENVAKKEWPVLSRGDDKSVSVACPNGYKFILHPLDVTGDCVQKVAIAASDLDRSVDYWNNKCGMKLYEKNSTKALLGFGDSQCKLELVSLPDAINRASAFGRIAFSAPRDQLPKLQEEMDKAGEKVLTRLVSLDTPGKATVEVVILADPDQHEICFVGKEAFSALSQVDPAADSLIDAAIAKDKSIDWFSARGGKGQA